METRRRRNEKSCHVLRYVFVFLQAFSDRNLGGNLLIIVLLAKAIAIALVMVVIGCFTSLEERRETL